MKFPPHLVRFPVHAGSRPAEGKNAPQPKRVEKTACWDLFTAVRAYNCRTKKTGHQDGAIGRNGLMVLSGLISFTSWETGRCDPSYSALAERLGMCERSVYAGLQALKAAKVITWSTRWINAAGELGGWLMRQVSNLYSFNFSPPWRRSAPPPRPEPGTWGDHPSEGDGHARGVAAIAAGASIDSAMEIQRQNAEHPAEAGAVMARIWNYRRQAEAIIGKPWAEMTEADYDTVREKIRAAELGKKTGDS